MLVVLHYARRYPLATAELAPEGCALAAGGRLKSLGRQGRVDFSENRAQNGDALHDDGAGNFRRVPDVILANASLSGDGTELGSSEYYSPDLGQAIAPCNQIVLAIHVRFHQDWVAWLTDVPLITTVTLIFPTDSDGGNNGDTENS